MDIDKKSDQFFVDIETETNGNNSIKNITNNEDHKDKDENEQQVNEYEKAFSNAIESELHEFIIKAQSLEEKINEIKKAFIELFEKHKCQFLEQMEKIKEEISTFVNEQTQAWIKISTDSHESMQRLHAARDLVQSLGLELETTHQISS